MKLFDKPEMDLEKIAWTKKFRGMIYRVAINNFRANMDFQVYMIRRNW